MVIYAVDDERLALELLEDSIKEAIKGSNPICFDEVEAFLEAMKTKAADIVFLDIKMPGMNGITLAKRVNKISPSTKIVFVTGFSNFTKDAFDVFASGYIMKPCSAKSIKKVMEKIGLDDEVQKDIVIRTFGNFDIFYKGNPVVFRSPKSKELLAYLVDREGGFVSRKEMACVLFEDDFTRSAQVKLSQFAMRLSEDLESAGITDFFFSKNGYYVDLSVAECDMIEYLSGNPKYTYFGEYMEQYSWGEYKKYNFETN